MRGGLRISLEYWNNKVNLQRLPYFDTHAHLDDPRIAEDPDFSKLLTVLEENHFKVLIPAVNMQSVSSIAKIKTLASNISPKLEIFWAIGIHPHDAKEYKTSLLSTLLSAASTEGCVAIGEVGLDYYYNFSEPQIQKKTFEAMVNVATKAEKTLILHLREQLAYEDAFSILTSFSNLKKIVLHCYSSNVAMAKRFLEKFDCYFGIGGVVTFKNATTLREVVKYLPLDRILLETDSPYLAPTPYRGYVNSPLFLPLIVQKIAEIKQTDLETVAAFTNQNALNCFNLL